MKTTIKTYLDDVVVGPSRLGNGCVDLCIETPSPNGGHRAYVYLTPDQVGALIVGLECAAAKAAA